MNSKYFRPPLCLCPLGRAGRPRPALTNRNLFFESCLGSEEGVKFKFMRKVIFLTLAVFAIFLGYVVIRMQVRARQSQAIVAVFTQANSAHSEARVMLNGRPALLHRQPVFSDKKYLLALEGISTSDCPEPFRLAWLNYLQTAERSDTPFSGLGAVGEYALSVVKPSSVGAKDALARLDKINTPEAWMRVETVALEYGVQLLPAKSAHY